MQKTKTYTLVTRGISKSEKNKLKRIAKLNRLSVNKLMLKGVDYLLGNEVSIQKEILS